MTQATDNVTNCVADLASDKSEVDYMVCTLKDKALLDVAESGMGGREAVVRYLKDSCEDKVATGAFLVLAVDDRGNTRSVRRKYIHYIWIGPKTPVMAKAKVASQSGKFKEVFAKTLTLSIQTDNLDDFAEAKLEGRLRAAGGAHQPTSFDFSNSSANAVSHTMGAGAIASAGAPVRAAPPSATSSPSEAAGAIAAAKAQGSTFKVPAKEQVKAEEPAGVELDDPVDEGVAGEMDAPVENENEDM